MINPDWQDAVLIYKDSEGNKQEQYFYATANNQKSWVENFDDYSNHDYHNAAQSDADFAEKAEPLAKGLALLVSPISLYNSGKYWQQERIFMETKQKIKINYFL